MSPITERMNRYEFAHRAEQVMGSIACGPDDRSCDGAPDARYACPAHGGLHDEREDWTPEDQAAYDNFHARWSEVMA